MEAFWAFAIATWVCSGVVGAVIGSRNNAAAIGFLLGLLFGPLGAIGAFALDGRIACPMCRNKIDAGVGMCPTCHAQLVWFDSEAFPKERLADLMAARERHAIARRALEEARHEASIRLAAEYDRRMRAVYDAVATTARTITRTLFRIFTSPFKLVDGWLSVAADGSHAMHKALRGLVLLPLLLMLAIALPIALRKPPVIQQAQEREHELDARPQVVQEPENPIAQPVPIDPAPIEQVPIPKQPPINLPGVAINGDVNPNEHPPNMRENDIAQHAAPPVRVKAVEMPEPEAAKPDAEQPPEHQRPIAVEGVKNPRDPAEAQDQELLRQKIKDLERKIQVLSNKRRVALANARRAAVENAQLDLLRAQTGIPFGGSMLGIYTSEAEELLTQIKQLRTEVDNLKKQKAP